MIYLDSAATSLQKPPVVARACSYAISHYASPGRGGHKPAMDAAAAAFACREAAARLFQVPKPEQVVFTNNATHGLNIAIKALVRPGGTVVISGYEHNAVTRPLHAIPDVTVRVAAGQLFRPEETVEAFRKALTPEVTAAVFTHVSNVFGMILPIQELARLCREREGILREGSDSFPFLFRETAWPKTFDSGTRSPASSQPDSTGSAGRRCSSAVFPPYSVAISSPGSLS